MSAEQITSATVRDRRYRISMNRILVIRGGAIGDFVLTLPALKALREANPGAHIDLLGYKHIAELANNRFYANGVRSIEYAPLARFFAKDSELSSDLRDYFSSFDLIISYLYDPDQIFQINARRCGVRQFVVGPGKIGDGEHASRQLAEPMEKLGLKIASLAAKIYPSAEDRQFASNFLDDFARPSPSRTGIVAFHPGSGSEKKNWPLQNWIDLGNSLLNSPNFHGSILVVGGEADEARTGQFKSSWSDYPRVRFAESLALPHLAAVLEQTLYLGHDSGISHLAAAAGANCILFFGPTNPAVWAPQGENVRILRAAGGNLCDLPVETVLNAIWVAAPTAAGARSSEKERRSLSEL
jgi:heptosyltransferase III